MTTTPKPSQTARLRRACVSGVTVLALFFVAASPAAACDSGAVKTVEKIYKTYEADEFFNNFAPEIYSSRMQPLVKAWNTRCEANVENEGCMLDGNFFIDGNDFKISKLKVSCLSGDEEKSRVMVKFRNFDTPSTKVFDMVKDGDSWLIDEIADGKDGKGFLGEIFKMP